MSNTLSERDPGAGAAAPGAVVAASGAVSAAAWAAAVEAIHSLGPADEIQLVCHVSPDGDALGSMLGFGLGLRRLGHTRLRATFPGEFEVPEPYRSLPGSDLLVPAHEAYTGPALLLVFDVAAESRLGDLAGLLPAARDVIVLDHHASNTGFCREGVLRFSYDLLTSREAERFLWAPDRQTNAVYLALLNRAPDPSGWATYLAMNRAEGIDRSTVDIMKSSEYRNRLRSICNGRHSPSRVGVYNVDEVAAIVQNLLTAALVGSVNCGITAIVKKMQKLKGRGHLPTIAAYSGQISTKIAGTNEACKLAKQLALGAAWAAYIGSRNHPVYVYELETHDKPGNISKTIRLTYAIGWTPSDTRTFAGSFKVSRF